MMPPPTMTTRACVGKDPAISEPAAQSRIVHLAHLGYPCFHRIAAGRRIDRGHLGELVEMLALHAKLGQRMRNADLAAEIEAPFHEAVECGLDEAEPTRQADNLFLDRRPIEL